MNEYCMHCMGRLDDDGRCPTCGNVEPPEIAPHQLTPGTVLVGRYLVGNILGQGGFGITYIGRDLLLDLPIAVKEYYPTGYANRHTGASDKVTVTGEKNGQVFDQGRQRFLDEARSLAKYRGDPGIVDILNFFEANGTAYIVMEYLDGIDLLNVLKDTGTLPAEWVFDSFQPIMASLEHMHADHVYHRDISPDNIMFLKDGTLRLMDFGAARTIQPDNPRTISVMLKAGYAPEEQYRANGKQGPWTDIYALCATMYKCITGITPADSLQRQKGADVVWPSALGIAIDQGYEDIIRKGMSLAAEDRYQSIAQMRTAMAAVSRIGNTGADSGAYRPVDENQTRYVTRDLFGAAGWSAAQEATRNEASSVRAPDNAPLEQPSYCIQCGHALEPDSRFCTFCGTEVVPSVAPPTPKPAADRTIATPKPAAAPTPPATKPPVAPTPPKGGGRNKPNNRRLPVIAAIIALAVVALVAAFVGLGGTGGGDNGGGIAAKADLQSYEWSELSAISQEISEAADHDAAIEIAGKYNLVDADGKLDDSQTKLVEIDGKKLPVRIIGFNHDTKTDGGTAGITFQFVDCIDDHAMNNALSSDDEFERYAERRGVPVSQIRSDHPDAVPTNDGGWENSSMRSWLTTNTLPELPADLRETIVAVDKETNNTGKTSNTGAVTVTSDKLWLLSKAEICGPENCDSAVTKEEGTTYQLFQEMGVGAKGTAALKKTLEGKSTSYWWLRSSAAQSDIYFLAIDKDGGFNPGWSDAEYGVAPCFCV